MAKAKHYFVSYRPMTVGAISTLCDRNPNHPEAIALMAGLDTNSPRATVQVSRVRIEAIEKDREFVLDHKDVGKSIEVRPVLGEPLGNQTRTGVSAEGENDVDEPTPSGGGCCG